MTQDDFDKWCEYAGVRWHRIESASPAEKAAARIWLAGQQEHQR